MENFEINILKRNGDWKKYNQKDISLSSAKNTDQEELNVGVIIEIFGLSFILLLINII